MAWIQTVKVTTAAPTMTPTDLDRLRGYGFTDEALFAIVEVVGFSVMSIG